MLIAAGSTVFSTLPGVLEEIHGCELISMGDNSFLAVNPYYHIVIDT
jgi:hypothetical protein